MRVCVFIADAPAHGFSSSGGDDFPKGMCPDQHTPLPELITDLATTHGVDLLCTKLSGYTNRMYQMFRAQYQALDASGAGFGVLRLEQGASKFKAVDQMRCPATCSRAGVS